MAEWLHFTMLFLNKAGKKMMFIGAFLVLVIVFVFAWFYPVFCFFRRYQQAESCPLALNRGFVRTEIKIPETNTQAHLFRPKRSAGTTLVVIHGLHPFGIHEPRLQNFAESLAESGFQVVTPDIAAFRKFQITPESIDLIANLIDALPNHVSRDSMQNVGLLGISYGAGPVFIAASRKELRNKIHFVVSIGGYYNFLNSIDFALTGIHPSGKGKPVVPQQWGRMIFALNNIESLAPSVDVPLFQESLSLRLNLKEDEARNKEAGLSEEGNLFLKHVLEGLPQDEIERFQKTLRQRTETAKLLSPQFIVNQLPPELRIYLLHGSTDDLIPSVETEEFAEALQKHGHPNVRSLISVTLTHVDPVESGLMDSLRLVLWTKALLGEAK